MTYTCKLVENLALLGLELDFVGERLPSAAAASAEMLAKGLQTIFGGLFKLNYAPLKKIGFFPCDTHIYYISGNCKFYKKNSAWSIRIILGQVNV